MARAVRHMNPCKVVFVDSLVHWQILRAQQVVEPAVVGRVACGDVGGLSLYVLTGWRTAHLLVEAWAAVAAIHVYGFSPSFAQRVEDVLHELLKATDGFS